MDEETRSFKFASTNCSIWIAQISTIRWFANQYSTDESSKKQFGKHHKKPIPITPDSLLVRYSDLKTYHLHRMPLSHVILREAEGEVAESTDMNEPTPSRRGGTVDNCGWGPGRNTFTGPSSALPDTLCPWVKVFLWFLKCGFCNSGQALRAEWHESEMAEWYESEKTEWMRKSVHSSLYRQKAW